MNFRYPGQIDRPGPPGVQRFVHTLAFLARDGFVAHRGLPGHDGQEDSSLPEVLNPYGVS